MNFVQFDMYTTARLKHFSTFVIVKKITKSRVMEVCDFAFKLSCVHNIFHMLYIAILCLCNVSSKMVYSTSFTDYI